MKKRMVQQNVKNEVHEDRTFRFYRIMWYPIPLNSGVFAFRHKYKVEETGNSFSWNERSKFMDEYIHFINKWWFLYRNFPFVKEIYLANSISFNALSSDSDIDIFVVCYQWRVWTARLFMSLFMLIFWIKRNNKIFSKKFCLSFFIWEDRVNLSDILIDEKDIYLPYWIAHLVPIYLHDWYASIFTNNDWIEEYLPNYNMKQNIFLWNKLYRWNWLFKNMIEFLLCWKIWFIFEKILQKKWGARMRKIMSNNPESHEWNICEKSMLKFYKDMRKYYSDLFFSSDN